MSNHTRMWLAVIPAFLVALALFGVATAGPVNTPVTFQPNTPARASEVNTNFAAHEAAIDDNDSRITSNSNRLTNLEGGLVNGIVRGAAAINEDGTVDRFFNLRGGNVTIFKNSVGVYRVTFQNFTDLQNRFYSVTVGLPDGGGEEGFGSVSPFFNSPNDTLFVETRDESGTLVDRPFHLIVF